MYYHGILPLLREFFYAFILIKIGNKRQKTILHCSFICLHKERVNLVEDLSDIGHWIVLKIRLSKVEMVIEINLGRMSSKLKKTVWLLLLIIIELNLL